MMRLSEEKEFPLNCLVFSLSRLIGLTPFTSGGNLSAWLAVRSITLSTLVIGLTGYTILSGNLIMTGPDSQIVEMQLATSLVQFPLMTAVALSAAGFAAARHHHHRSALLLLANLEPTKTIYWHSAPSLAFLVTSFIYDFSRWYSSTQRILTLLSYYIPLIIIIIVESQFTYSLELVKDRYTTATHALLIIKSPRQLRQLLLKVRGIDKACMLINQTYTLSLLQIFGTFFGLFISEMYYFITSLIAYSKNVGITDDLFSLFAFLNVIFLLIFEIWKITWYSSTTKEKMATFNKKLYGLCIVNKNKNFCGNVWVQSHLQKKQKDVQITAYHFFNIELSILQSMLGAAATYLVIMLQFQLSYL